MNDNRGKRLVKNEPKLMNEWDFERNQKNGLYPVSISVGSHKIAYWICSANTNINRTPFGFGYFSLLLLLPLLPHFALVRM